ncbi:transcriptional regulators YebC [Candidatus Termititenax dinenymphae]|uniref:Probable transcriptional regulatory protein RDn1_042 n=1 Tax=Candidatus Termititenax dinenymphae TaxID=2218523 RepID=A0A388TJA9_9BACT|nr:transcriptional regulators YebC [Candidatus Termititenax dinenymphae]
MSGHNKWSKIKYTKGKADAVKGKAFSKAAMDIITAVKEGGSPDPALNSRLRMAIDYAKKVNMPNDNIKRAIERGAGKEGGIDNVTYEGYAPGGVAMLIECQTDNRNRTASDVRSTLEKNGGNLGTPGSVSFMFHKKGLLVFAADGVTEDKLMEVLLDAGADDIKDYGEDGFEVTCGPADFDKCVKAAEAAGLKIDNAEITLIADNTLAVDEHNAEKILNLIEKIEDCDDVQKVSHNADISDEIMNKLAEAQ